MTYQKSFQTIYADYKNVFAGHHFGERGNRLIVFVALELSTGGSYRWINHYLDHMDGMDGEE